MTNVTQELTAAQKRKITRLRNKAKQSQAYEHRNEMFESMSDEEREDMTSRLENIKDEYSRRMEEAEEEILSDLRAEFADIKSDYSYDTIKSYVEEFGNGRTGFPAYLDLNDWIDEYKDETSFEYVPDGTVTLAIADAL